ncbi:hypothetical protein A8926_6844 [Saccharopolyspora spinosa]|uniref:Uncharacterized protein n=1 Tax=Saccharopolyspora spinosa TaxID=60894 RepID=A0A2N3Y739_SACSN|nr:hypothetical protein A8926_6844 [Saccharopolyspora spinosa]
MHPTHPVRLVLPAFTKVISNYRNLKEAHPA